MFCGWNIHRPSNSLFSSSSRATTYQISGWRSGWNCSTEGEKSSEMNGQIFSWVNILRIKS